MVVPVRTAAVKDEDGNMCNTPEMQQQRWRRHFTKILNLQSEFSMEELSKVRQRPLRPAMAAPPHWAKICLDGSLLEQVDVLNDLKQGCCLAPVLFITCSLA